MRYAKRIFNFILKNNKFYIVIIVVLLLIVIFQWMVPGYYDYNQISTLVYCDKNPSDQHRYLLFPMVTIVFDGGLGNQLFEVFSLLGLALKLNRTAIFNSEDWILHSKLNLLREQVPQVAERVISIPIEIPESSRFIYSPACCHFQFSPLLSCEQSKYLVIDGHYFQSHKYFSSIETSIRKWLNPPQEEEKLLKKMIRRKDEFRFKICVHIRRGDFLTDSQHAGTASNFTIRAVDHLYTQHPGLVYLFSNDPGWVREKIAAHLDYQSDVKVMETSEAIKDLYFAQIHCDAVLITAPSSTFGWWLGYLSKNQSSVYYRDIQETEDMVKHQMVEEDFFPSTWKKLGMSQNGLIISK
ncbi:L-Fucosyltransferase [Caenorhabditis elegans]|uniref:L-Fucosyltransferase n=1 Tax=Caenorhabditis elegans TaxID=6239 RepID=O01660_CAEEL|nr:L-Fucosyltransferase [Caenorhabditis elegans]CCD68369.1 L-Fucosyltransferase [Caenorhabditis elegans]|eukprot:NP_491192.2 Uncharacterized protein CELE_T28F2.1 [Caenorhabditis elegans]